MISLSQLVQVHSISTQYDQIRRDLRIDPSPLETVVCCLLTTILNFPVAIAQFHTRLCSCHLLKGAFFGTPSM